MTTPNDRTTYQQARRRVRARRDLYQHAAIYAVVNLMLFLLDYLTPGGPWFFWPLFGWGIGLASHAVAVVFDELWDGKEREEEAIERYLQQHSKA